MKKASDSLDRMGCMKILQGYGIGKNLQRLLERFWGVHTVVARTEGWYSRPLKMEQGVTQGYLLTPTTLDTVVDAAVGATLMEVCGPQEAQHGLGWAAGDQEIIFNADDGRISERKIIWFQGILTTLI